MSGNVDGEALRRTLERQDLVELLQGLDGNQLDSPECPVTDFGKEVKRQVNYRLGDESHAPIQASDFQVGYVTALYEALTETNFEAELLHEQPSNDGAAR
jgi:hypothetical protein